MEPGDIIIERDFDRGIETARQVIQTAATATLTYGDGRTMAVTGVLLSYRLWQREISDAHPDSATPRDH